MIPRTQNNQKQSHARGSRSRTTSCITSLILYPGDPKIHDMRQTGASIMRKENYWKKKTKEKCWWYLSQNESQDNRHKVMRMNQNWKLYVAKTKQKNKKIKRIEKKRETKKSLCSIVRFKFGYDIYVSKCRDSFLSKRLSI